MRTTRVPTSRCPACDTRLSAATDFFAAGVPQEGDVTVCLECGVVLRFGPDLVLERLTEAARQALSPRLRVMLGRFQLTRQATKPR